MNDTRRITLVARGQGVPDRDWDHMTSSMTRLVTIESMTVLRYTLRHAVAFSDLDIERVILDRSFSASDYLDVLASLPPEFNADMLLIRIDESGYLSSAGRGGDRSLHALRPEDVRFYLEANQVVTGRMQIEEVRPRRLSAA